MSYLPLDKETSNIFAEENCINKAKFLSDVVFITDECRYNISTAANNLE